MDEKKALEPQDTNLQPSPPIRNLPLTHTERLQLQQKPKGCEIV